MSYGLDKLHDSLCSFVHFIHFSLDVTAPAQSQNGGSWQTFFLELLYLA